jgi:carboxymethylenebutenolidase
MTAYQRYLAEEVAIDHADGFLSRREALRRLSLLGFTVPAATALLAACGGSADESAPPPASSSAQQTAGAKTPAGPKPLATEAVTFAGPQGRTLRGAWASAANPRGAILVIHENRGLNPHIASVAGRLATSGYAALAIDLLSEEGGTEAVGDEAAAMAALSEAPPERLAADMKAGVSELARRVPGKKLGATGFCFGGGMVWLLLSSGEPRLAAAIRFYGPLPDDADFSRSKAAVLAFYGALDQRVTSTRDAAAAALERAGLTHEAVTYEGANHAFFNDTGERYNATAAAQAYQRLLDWFGRYLG